MYARAPRNCDIKVYRMYVQRCFNFYIQIMLEIVYIYMIVCFALKQFSREVIETVSIYYLIRSFPLNSKHGRFIIKLFARSNRFPFVSKENEWNNTGDERCSSDGEISFAHAREILCDARISLSLSLSIFRSRKWKSFRRGTAKSRTNKKWRRLLERRGGGRIAQRRYRKGGERKEKFVKKENERAWYRLYFQFR